MTEIGIPFNTSEVKAIAEGRKTMHMRAFKMKAGGTYPDFMREDAFERLKKNGPFGVAGDRIFVREAFVQGYEVDTETGELIKFDSTGRPVPMCTWFKASDGDMQWQGSFGGAVSVPWKPSNHMPKHLARTWLDITSVDLVPLHSITEAQAQLLGYSIECMSPTGEDNGSALWGPAGLVNTWEKAHGTWYDNPWIWICSFDILPVLKDGDSYC